MNTIWVKRALWTVASGLAVAGLAWHAWPRPVAVDIAAVVKRPMQVTVDDEGKTRVRHVYTVSAPIAGRVLRISRPDNKHGVSLHVGDLVKAGDTAVAVMQAAIPGFIDVRSREELQAAVKAADAAITLAEAEISRIEAALAFSRDELKRAQTLSRTGTIASRTLEKAQLDVATNEAALASARAQLAVRHSERTSIAARLIDPASVSTPSSTNCCVQIRAPVSGRVLKIIQDSEAVVAAGSTLSRNLCRAYRERFGEILHHNVDKALLCGGRAAPAFGGGSVLNPISVYLAGRATAKVNSDSIDIREIAIEGSRSWLRANLHALDVERDVKFHVLIEPGSQELQHLFARRHQLHLALANDTSIGVGHAPLTPLEHLVLSVECAINGRDRARDHPAWGEDMKIMALRSRDMVHLTVACAMIGRYLAHMDDYLAEKAALEKAVLDLAMRHGFSACEVSANAADYPSTGTIYLTVTGTSAEAGDDGQVGRGNRVNGLITPCRRMSLEAAAGKNPVTHVGKIYNVLANQLAQMLVGEIPEVATAECRIASRIGRPPTTPAIVQVNIATEDGRPVDSMRRQVEDVAASCVSGAPKLVDDFVAGAISVF